MKQRPDDWYEKHARIKKKPNQDNIEIESGSSSRRYRAISEVEDLAQRHADKLLIFGLRLKQIHDPIRIGNLMLYPNFNLRK